MITADTENKPVTAVLAALDTGEYDTDESLKELTELAKTANAYAAAQIVQKRASADSATVLGEGKIKELTDTVDALDAKLVIFDTELTASEIRNIENAVNVRVIDRTMLILDIFAQRAVSNEGKLQVELAQLKYRLPRLNGLGRSLSRLGGGIGTRGPGEKQLETDRRHIKRRIEKLENDLKELTRRRDMYRSRRKKDNLLTAAIVGYTNVGKSTLLNTLTKANVLAEDKLFATLDLTSRAVELPDGRNIILTDTVGLIRRLPHHLVEAFRSTLEEAANADIILHVSDISDPQAAEKNKTALKILAELGCGEIPVIDVLNKADLVDYDIPESDNTVKISAKTGEGTERMLSLIAKNLPSGAKRATLLIPYSDVGFSAEIRSSGKIFSEEYTENGIITDALIDASVLKKAERMMI